MLSPSHEDSSGAVQSHRWRFRRQSRRAYLNWRARRKSGGADLAVFSELCLCGYPPQDLIERPAFAERNQTELARLAREDPAAVAGRLRRQGAGQHRQARGQFRGADRHGKILFEQRKMLLPTYDVFDETRYFQPAHTQHAFRFGAETLGITICEDIWNDKNFWPQRLYERDPVAELVGKGSTVLLNISSSPYTLDKRGLRHDMLRAMAREHRVPVVYVNQVGGNDSLIFDGSSVAFMPDGTHRRAGEIVRRGSGVLRYANRRGRHSSRRSTTRSKRPTRAGARHARLRSQMRLPQGGHRAERRNRFGAGGHDRRGCARAAKTCTGVAMPGPYSSEGSLRDAQQLARNLGIELLVLPIGDTFASLPARLCERRLPDLPEDATEENIQARIRGNLLMALSNKFGSLVLSTGNKSEMAVGYCTLYGDMAGGLAVISDVPKTNGLRPGRSLRIGAKEQNPGGNLHQAALGRTAPEPNRPGHPAALRSARPHS